MVMVDFTERNGRIGIDHGRCNAGRYIARDTRHDVTEVVFVYTVYLCRNLHSDYARGGSSFESRRLIPSSSRNLFPQRDLPPLIVLLYPFTFLWPFLLLYPHPDFRIRRISVSVHASQIAHNIPRGVNDGVMKRRTNQRTGVFIPFLLSLSPPSPSPTILPPFSVNRFASL